ncbi:MAG TPA: alpha-L-arabinofuranosidase C-terminal domain-containing protein [Gemmataceae bacterium]|nr:alpha-L-arabinofuranosidase C-terminal domain-containing protein [Gemmataceae bacterium]
MRHPSVPLAILLFLLGRGNLPAQEAMIQVRANDLVARTTRHMTGACLEDVNHEVYGGIYSQMIFGESFQEAAPTPPIKHFTLHGGSWAVRDGVLSVPAGEGPKLVSEHPPLGTGEVRVEVLLPGKAGGVAGLVVKVREPRTGADRFIGYEISLSSEPAFVRLGRHRNNWEPIKDVPCAVPADRWLPLVVRMEKTSLEILLDGKKVLAHEDRDHPLDAGAVGLRTFGRECRFRNLQVKTGEKVTDLPFEPERRWDEGVSRMWRGLRRGSAAGRFALETRDPFVGRQSQRIVFEKGEGEVGVENQGLNRWGMSFVKGKPYEGYAWLRADKVCTVAAALEGQDGKVLAEAKLAVPAGAWKRVDFTLTPGATDRAGRFALKLQAPGSVRVGHAFLQSGAWGRFKKLPVRKDVAEKLLAGGLTVLRYGGSMVNAPEYRWKKMIGPRDRRPPYRGWWYPHSSNGWGVVDFLAFCEAADILAIPAFHMDETPADMADFIEYVNGPADSPWGRKRAADGHPKPYRLTHLELGNEEAVDEEYWRRFKPMAEAIWARDPSVVLVVGDFAYNARIKDPFDFPGAPRIKSLAAHKKILELAKARGRAVWFDVHVWNNDPRNPDEPGGGILGLRDFGAALKTLCPGADFKVCVFEENAGNHTLRRGLAHAHAVNELERSGDLVPIVCAANCLQPDHQNDNGWDQGLLFLNPSRVWGQPSYYVTRMVARHYLPRCVAAEVASPGDALDVTVKRSDDGKVLQLQVVNLDRRPVATRITLEGFAPSAPTAAVTELAGKLEDENTSEEPERVVPRTRAWRHGSKGGRVKYTFPPLSFTILRFKGAPAP